MCHYIASKIKLQLSGNIGSAYLRVVSIEAMLPNILNTCTLKLSRLLEGMVFETTEISWKLEGIDQVG